jgi:hypothetical protein
MLSSYPEGVAELFGLRPELIVSLQPLDHPAILWSLEEFDAV